MIRADSCGGGAGAGDVDVDVSLQLSLFASMVLSWPFLSMVLIANVIIIVSLLLFQHYLSWTVVHPRR